ncbi:LPXTG cell wall anchor domain-containing protein [Ligilactobacillus agilis]|uniref:LPXTG cell wall anchor domain-containing protein n=1 Tax=Ligilactobacillus agilis TaxID=1601 RepID=UPI0025A34A67|nr:LPXTG cell wall anchor domain-containing protein [Ligilactobacillus agilis]MDM8279123.1 LPXTG cell wall anchor domain-containing protein [Ligilactobacillus agilis]
MSKTKKLMALTTTGLALTGVGLGTASAFFMGYNHATVVKAATTSASSSSILTGDSIVDSSPVTAETTKNDSGKRTITITLPDNTDTYAYEITDGDGDKVVAGNVKGYTRIDLLRSAMKKMLDNQDKDSDGLKLILLNKSGKQVANVQDLDLDTLKSMVDGDTTSGTVGTTKGDKVSADVISTGDVVATNTKNDAGDRTVTISVPDNSTTYHYQLTDDNGKVITSGDMKGYTEVELLRSKLTKILDTQSDNGLVLVLLDKDGHELAAVDNLDLSTMKALVKGGQEETADITKDTGTSDAGTQTDSTKDDSKASESSSSSSSKDDSKASESSSSSSSKDDSKASESSSSKSSKDDSKASESSSSKSSKDDSKASESSSSKSSKDDSEASESSSSKSSKDDSKASESSSSKSSKDDSKAFESSSSSLSKADSKTSDSSKSDTSSQTTGADSVVVTDEISSFDKGYTKGYQDGFNDALKNSKDNSSVKDTSSSSSTGSSDSSKSSSSSSKNETSESSSKSSSSSSKNEISESGSSSVSSSETNSFINDTVDIPNNGAGENSSSDVTGADVTSTSSSKHDDGYNGSEISNDEKGTVASDNYNSGFNNGYKKGFEDAQAGKSEASGSDLSNMASDSYASSIAAEQPNPAVPGDSTSTDGTANGTVANAGSEDNQNGNTSATNGTNGDSASNQTLPQTGSTKRNLLATVGLGAGSILSGFGVFFRKIFLHV